MAVTVVIRMPDGSEDQLIASTLEVTTEGTLQVYNQEISSETTTDRTLFGKRTTTEIIRKKYLSGVYPKGCWVAAYSKVSKVDAEGHNEPYN